MDSYEPYPSIALALVAGLLIGLEREQSRPTDEHRVFPGGIRTYPIISLIGAVAMLLSPQLGAWPLIMAGLVVGGLLIVSYWRDSGTGHLGLTSESATILTILLGALSAARGLIEPLRLRIFVVASIAVAVTVLLSAKTTLRRLSARVSGDDVIAMLKFLIVAVVVFPILPNEPLGPYGALNPFRIGLMVSLIAGINFAGYVAMRVLGPDRGLIVTGAVGGLASSTAVTLSSAARARESPELAHTAALAVTVASSIMFVRVLGIVAVVERDLLGHLLSVVVMTVVAAGLTLGLYLRDRGKVARSKGIELSNPFELTTALKFGAFFVVILVISRWAQDAFGNSGSYVAGALAGLTDVDAITLSMSNLVKNHSIDADVAARTIAIAVSSNTVVKALMALALGGRVFGTRIAIVFAIVLAAGIASMPLL